MLKNKTQNHHFFHCKIKIARNCLRGWKNNGIIIKR